MSHSEHRFFIGILILSLAFLVPCSITLRLLAILKKHIACLQPAKQMVKVTLHHRPPFTVSFDLKVLEVFILLI